MIGSRLAALPRDIVIIAPALDSAPLHTSEAEIYVGGILSAAAGRLALGTLVAAILYAGAVPSPFATRKVATAIAA